MQSQSMIAFTGKRRRPCIALRPVRRAHIAPASPHVEVLRAGARAWNAWRRKNPGIVPVLDDLNVSATERQFGRVQGGPINLSRAEFRRARLDQATLIEANLMGAMLTEADLSYARLDHADLRGARLAYAALGGARLNGANLCGADLRLSQGLTQSQIDQAVGDSRTALPGHLTTPTAWLRQSDPDLRAAETQAGEQPGTGAPTSGQSKKRRGRSSHPPLGSRIVIAAVLAGAVGAGILTAMLEAYTQRRSNAPGDALSATHAIVHDVGSPAPASVPYAPSG